MTRREATSKSDEDLDVLGFAAARDLSHSARFGAVDTVGAMRSFTTTAKMNERPTARMTLDLRLLPAPPIDYFAPLSVIAHHDNIERPLFTGTVVSARPGEDELIEIEATGLEFLAEQTMPTFTATGVPPGEVFHLVTRSAGMREEQLRIEGLDKLPLEMFEVLAPLDGVAVHERVDLGVVQLLPPDVVLPKLEGMAGPFAAAPAAEAYAIAYPTARRMLDAETLGLSAIDDALGWLIVRARYGAALLPDGTPQLFLRRESVAQPRRVPVVLVRGLGSQRRWSRETTAMQSGGAMQLSPHHRFVVSADQLADQSEQTKQAILALARATAEDDPLARVGALWEAIEFFVGRYAPAEELFSQEARSQVVASLPAVLTERQRARVETLVNEQLNNLPLRTRLEGVLDRDRIAHTDEEVEALFNLRRARNKAVHGAARVAPAVEDLQQATAFVARLLVHRVSGQSPG